MTDKEIADKVRELSKQNNLTVESAIEHLKWSIDYNELRKNHSQCPPTNEIYGCDLNKINYLRHPEWLKLILPPDGTLDYVVYRDGKRVIKLFDKWNRCIHAVKVPDDYEKGGEDVFDIAFYKNMEENGEDINAYFEKFFSNFIIADEAKYQT